MSSFMTLFALGEHYDKSYNVFKLKSSQTEVNLHMLQSYLPSLIQRTISSSEFEQRSHLNILSVGSRRGDTDHEIVKVVQRELEKHAECYKVKIFNRAIEPNQVSCKQYKEAIEKLGDHIPAKFEVRQQTFQEYQAEAVKEPTSFEWFDIVHFIHSIYFVDVEETLLYCLEKQLNAKGYFVCLLENKGPVHTILKKQGYVWNAKNSASNDEGMSTKMIKIADKYGWKHEIYSKEYPIDVTELFDAESIDGNLLLDFFAHTVNFRKTADKQLVKETLAALMEDEELTFVKNGKRFAKKTDSLIFIYK